MKLLKKKKNQRRRKIFLISFSPKVGKHPIEFLPTLFAGLARFDPHCFGAASNYVAHAHAIALMSPSKLLRVRHSGSHAALVALTNETALWVLL